MSKNSHTHTGPGTGSRAGHGNHPGARERVAAERLQAQRKAENRSRAVIAAVAAVVVAGGVVGSIALAGGGSPSSAGSAKGGSSSGSGVAVPANTSGSGGTVIVYGKADAPHTLDVYEDFRCPICDKLERADGTTIKQLADSGTYKIQYHMGTFLDDNLGGSGSQAALAAAGAALNESTAKFEQFRTVLFANQPDEQNDAFAGADHLLELASKVPGLRTAAFDQAVRNGTYKPWAQRVGEAFTSSGVTGTPTVRLDGTTLTLFDSSTGNPITPAQYQALVQQTIGAEK